MECKNLPHVQAKYQEMSKTKKGMIRERFNESPGRGLAIANDAPCSHPCLFIMSNLNWKAILLPAFGTPTSHATKSLTSFCMLKRIIFQPNWIAPTISSQSDRLLGFGSFRAQLHVIGSCTWTEKHLRKPLYVRSKQRTYSITLLVDWDSNWAWLVRISGCAPPSTDCLRRL